MMSGGDPKIGGAKDTTKSPQIPEPEQRVGIYETVQQRPVGIYIKREIVETDDNTLERARRSLERIEEWLHSKPGGETLDKDVSQFAIHPLSPRMKELLAGGFEFKGLDKLEGRLVFSHPERGFISINIKDVFEPGSKGEEIKTLSDPRQMRMSAFWRGDQKSYEEYMKGLSEPNDQNAKLVTGE